MTAPNATAALPQGDWSAQTAVMQQYFRLEAEHPGALVFLRLGEFGEVLHDDARKANRQLDITLTARGPSGSGPVVMAGVSAQALESDGARLIRLAKRWPSALGRGATWIGPLPYRGRP
jgi:DNA mismatch repair protein MutS